MKPLAPSRHQNPRGFTLIELLIVMVIIAILASVAYPVINKVILSAQKTKAGAAMSGIQTAIKGYYLEYSRYPLGPGSGSGSGTGAVTSGPGEQGKDLNAVGMSKELLLALMGESDQDVPNPREIVFLDPKLTNGDRGGFNEDDGTYYDPWGNSYVISIDGNYDNKLENPDAGADDDDGNADELRKTILVYSVGHDIAEGTVEQGKAETALDKSDKKYRHAVLSWK